jgi:hypothetical protein
LSYALTAFILERWVPQGVIYLAGDDTVTEHRGRKVYGKGRHRDAVRSSHSHTAHRYGHKWVTLTISVRFPFARRPWTLPIMSALYRTPECNQALGLRHKTPPHLMRQMLRVLLRRFPDRKFLFVGDGGFSAHESAALAQKYGGRLKMVGRFHPDAALYEPPPQRRKVGRPRKVGRKLPTPQQARGKAHAQRLKVSWYGGLTRTVAAVTGTGGWYRAGADLVQVRWVWVHDLDGTHRDEYFFTTDIRLSLKEIIEAYTGRWSIEVTFEEARAYLGFESTCGRSKQTVLRAEPCLLGLYSVVALFYAELPATARKQSRVHWEGKETTTFSDALSAVRRWLWEHWVFARSPHTPSLKKLPPALRDFLLAALTPAA